MSGDNAASDLPSIVRRVAGPDYEGPLSDYDEWHALEYGAMAGLLAALTLVRPGIASAVMALLGVRSIKDLATGKLKQQIVEERHYFGTGLVLAFGLTVLAIRGLSVGVL